MKRIYWFADLTRNIAAIFGFFSATIVTRWANSKTWIRIAMIISIKTFFFRPRQSTAFVEKKYDGFSVAETICKSLHVSVFDISRSNILGKVTVKVSKHELKCWISIFSIETKSKGNV